jgi:[NiFe] hydrogenase diaphorase moiety small subunit
VCPVGVILKKRVGFAVPIGQRSYDLHPISAERPTSTEAVVNVKEGG